MNTRLLFGLLWLTPTLCFGALSTDTSYFLNVEALTNVTARSAVRGLTGVFTNSVTVNSSVFTGLANPSASIGLSAVNGSATTVMRSDGAPALDQTIAPTWTGLHSFTKEITSTLGSISADASALDSTATWNNAGVTFTGLKMNITDTASASASMLINLTVGGADRFNIQKSGSVFGYGVAGNQAGYTFRVVGDSSSRAKVGLVDTSDNGGLTMGPGNATPDCVISRDGAANKIQYGFDSATPQAQTVKGPDGSGSNIAGGSLRIEGGYSTGTAAGGDFIIGTANSAGGTSSSLNTSSERFRSVAKWVTLTSATATTLFTIPVPATNYVGLTATVTIYATDGTDHQSKTSVITVDAIAKTTTITPTISQVDNTTAASAGTLTCTYTAVDNTSNVLAVKANADSSLTETVLRAKIVITAINASGTGLVTPQ